MRSCAIVYCSIALQPQAHAIAHSLIALQLQAHAIAHSLIALQLQVHVVDIHVPFVMRSPVEIVPPPPTTLDVV